MPDRAAARLARALARAHARRPRAIAAAAAAACAALGAWAAARDTAVLTGLETFLARDTDIADADRGARAARGARPRAPRRAIAPTRDRLARAAARKYKRLAEIGAYCRVFAPIHRIFGILELQFC